MTTREPVETEGGLRASLSLLRRNSDFRKLYLASAISLGGDWFLVVALFGLALELTGSAVSVALVIASMEIPYFLMSPVGGYVTDRLDRRRLMVACDVARAVLCLGFPFVRDVETMWVAYVLLAAISGFSAAFHPASSAAFPNLVERRDLAPANALFGSLWGTMLAVGAALGGLVADFMFSDPPYLIVNINGVYWHYERGIEKMARDRLQRIVLESKGWHVIVVDADDVLRDPIYYMKEAMRGIDHSRVGRGIV